MRVTMVCSSAEQAAKNAETMAADPATWSITSAIEVDGNRLIFESDEPEEFWYALEAIDERRRREEARRNLRVV